MPTSQVGLRPACTEAIACKICDEATILYGVVDMHRPCLTAGVSHPPLSGHPIYYRRCASCGFLFTDAFDDWTEQDFKTHIYNDGYLAVDPEYVMVRPARHAGLIAKLWAQHKDQIRVLDFGGGNDVFCSALRASGFREAVTYDPMVPEHAGKPDGKFDLVTCFETLEHMPNPVAGIGKIIECLAEPGAVFYSTLTQPADFDRLVCPGGMSRRATVTSPFSASKRWRTPGRATVTRTPRSMMAPTSRSVKYPSSGD